MITWLAVLILKHAVDVGLDEQGERINEYETFIRNHPVHHDVVRAAEADEAAFALKAEKTPVPPLLDADARDFTLNTVMRAAGRAYSTKCICANTTDSKPVDVASAIASELFALSDVASAQEAWLARISDSVSASGVVSSITKLLDDRQAVVVILRDVDGRILSAKLVAHSGVTTGLNKDAIVRLVGCPWTQAVILDQTRVSVLLTKEPEHVPSSEFAREKLKLRETPSKVSVLHSGPDWSLIGPKVAEMVSQLATIKRANEDAVSGFGDLKRKIDYAVQQKAEADEGDASVVESEAAKRIKATFEKLVHFEKRAMYVG